MHLTRAETSWRTAVRTSHSRRIRDARKRRTSLKRRSARSVRSTLIAEPVCWVPGHGLAVPRET